MPPSRLDGTYSCKYELFPEDGGGDGDGDGTASRLQRSLTNGAPLEIDPFWVVRLLKFIRGES